jgi:16S rRNA processing protein RimM
LEFKKNATLDIAGGNYRLASYRKVKNLLRFSLLEHQDINLVTTLIGEVVTVKSSEIKKPAKDEFYGHQLLGLAVFDGENNLLGEVITIEDTGFQKLLRIKKNDDKQALIPWVDFFVKKIDLNEKKIVIETIEGLL